jgi:hypothetical protein
MNAAGRLVWLVAGIDASLLWLLGLDIAREGGRFVSTFRDIIRESPVATPNAKRTHAPHQRAFYSIAS